MAPSIIWLSARETQSSPNNRARLCPYCSSDILQRWGRSTKLVLDTHELRVEVHRYRCTKCWRTFRAYPEGVDHHERSLRLRQIAALSWVLGLSLEEVTNTFLEFDTVLSRSTIWRDGQEIIRLLPENRRKHRVSPIKGNGGNGWIKGHQGGIVIVLELSKKKRLLLELIEDSTPESARNWLEPIAASLNLDLVVF
jgi:DNA-directed RNA polymerase subunit RPC12/RpoP